MRQRVQKWLRATPLLPTLVDKAIYVDQDELGAGVLLREAMERVKRNLFVLQRRLQERGYPFTAADFPTPPDEFTAAVTAMRADCTMYANTLGQVRREFLARAINEAGEMPPVELFHELEDSIAEYNSACADVKVPLAFEMFLRVIGAVVFSECPEEPGDPPHVTWFKEKKIDLPSVFPADPIWVRGFSMFQEEGCKPWSFDDPNDPEGEEEDEAIANGTARPRLFCLISPSARGGLMSNTSRSMPALK